MSDDTELLAQRLLDAQVEWAIGEFSGKRLQAMIARDVDDVLAIAAGMRLGDVVDPEAVKAAARRLVDVVGGSEVVAASLPAFSDAIYDLAASDDQLLGEVVDREAVDALVAKVIGMEQLHDRVTERLTESPLVATIASRYVTKLVGDFLQANRERAEKLPGVSSMFSIGLGAASKLRGATDQFLGDAQARSTQFAVRQTNGAMRQMIREAPVREAAMEIWDLHAGEPISYLREYLTAQDLRELLAIVHEIVTTARNLDYVGYALDECIDVFFDRYAETDLASLLTELGLTRDVLVGEIRRFAPPVVKAAKASGELDALVRTRLEPFFRSTSTHALLRGEATSPMRPKPAKK